MVGYGVSKPSLADAKFEKLGVIVLIISFL